MAFCEMHFWSASIQKQTSAYVVLPDGGQGPFAVFYLLHGLSDNHTIWVRRTSIERYVQNLPLMVVMPDGGRGWYTDAAQGPAGEAAIIKDLIPFIDRAFHTKAERAGRCIGGLSMGGYGAVKLGLKHPDMFVSANSHSGAVAIGHKLVAAQNQEFLRIFGEKPEGSQNDCFELAKGMHLPALRIDCGTEDFLLQDNRAFHKHLQDLGLEHEYEEFPGAHEWGYWDKHVQEAIAFHSKHLGITPRRAEGTEAVEAQLA